MDNKSFENILEEAPYPVFIQTEGKFFWLNNAACRMFGTESPEELKGKAVNDCIHPDYHHIVQKWIHPPNENDKTQKRLPSQKLVLKNGNKIRIEFNCQHVTYDDKNGTVVYLYSINQSHEASSDFNSGYTVNEKVLHEPTKEASSDLKSSYTLLRMAGKVAKFGGWTVDVPGNNNDLDNQLIKWSDAVADIHETPRGYLQRVKEGILFYAPEWREKISRAFEDCAQRGIPFDEEMEIITKKGKRIWIRTIGEAVREGSKIVKVQGALQDLTQIKHAEQKEKESEEKFRITFQNHSAIKMIIDPANGNIFEVNDAAVRYYGWTHKEMKQMNISQINIMPDKELKKIIKSAMISKSTHFDFRHKRADGEIRDVEIFSSKINIHGKDLLHSIIHDVTGKKRAERKLRLLSRSVEQSPVSIVITSINGDIEYVNPVFEKTTGYSLKEIKGKTLRILKSGYHSGEFYETLWSVILAGKDWSGELRNKKNNGQIYWEEVIISPILDQRGEVTNFVCVSEDITERKFMVDQLREAKEKAEESDRLKSAFLANMSHEIRTPMNAIMGFTEILKEPGLKSRTREEFIEKIEKSGRRMLDTVNDLIDISKIETGQVNMDLSEIDLKSQIEDICDFLRPQAVQKDLRLIIKYPKSHKLGRIYTDRIKLESILTNLIKNAIKFTDKGEIEIGIIPKDDFIEFYVSDTGIGVLPNLQKAIFKRFEQADTRDSKSFQGSGLGLAISKAYAELLGGDIWVESHPGQGATFYFTILKRKAVTEKPGQPEEKNFVKPGTPQLKGKKILIAEDDLFSREMIFYMLNKTGAALLLARDGMETIEKFQESGVDLVLLDIRLPKMDGYEVLKNLRAGNPDIPVIAQTAYALADDIKRFKKVGFTDYLTKPLGQDSLYATLNKYLG